MRPCVAFNSKQSEKTRCLWAAELKSTKASEADSATAVCRKITGVVYIFAGVRLPITFFAPLRLLMHFGCGVAL